MDPFDPRCADFNIFLDLTYWNIGASFLPSPNLTWPSRHTKTILLACNIFTDVCLGALPIPVIWKLQMKLRVRLYVIAILNLGYL
jgi:hypothetical protein